MYRVTEYTFGHSFKARGPVTVVTHGSTDTLEEALAFNPGSSQINITNIALVIRPMNGRGALAVSESSFMSTDITVEGCHGPFLDYLARSVALDAPDLWRGARFEATFPTHFRRK